MPKLKNAAFAYRDDIDSNIIIKAKSIHHKTFHLLVTCPYDKTRNQTFCPVCKRTDKVVPVLYGLPVWDSTGNIDGYADGKYYLGGCISDPYCRPTKHCNRCGKDF